MTHCAIKILVTTLLVFVISEVSKRSSLIGATLASVPLVSVLAMIWLYADTRDVVQVSALSRSIVWLVVPSLVLFLTLPILLQRGHDFCLSLAVSIGITTVAYFATIGVARCFGFRL